MGIIECFFYYICTTVFFAGSTIINNTFMKYNDTIYSVGYKCVVIATLFRSYIRQSIYNMYRRFFICGVKKISSSVYVSTYLYNNNIVRFPFHISKCAPNAITRIQYKCRDEDPYAENRENTNYINSFLQTRCVNVFLKPRYIGYRGIIITYMDDELNEVQKEYLHDDIIDMI